MTNYIKPICKTCGADIIRLRRIESYMVTPVGDDGSINDENENCVKSTVADIHYVCPKCMTPVDYIIEDGNKVWLKEDYDNSVKESVEKIEE